MAGKRRPIFGIGINDVDYNVYAYEYTGGKRKRSWICPFYRKWLSMLTRCYCNSTRKDNLTYEDCYINKEWVYLSNFKAWMEKQDWEGKDLDKDLLFSGNREYGPDTCVFVSRKVNLFLTEGKHSLNNKLIGVTQNKGSTKYIAACNSITGKRVYLGSFISEQTAHKAWLAFKLDQARILAAEQTDLRISLALINKYENYEVYL